MEACEDIRCTQGMKELYSHRKETIERIFVYTLKQGRLCDLPCFKVSEY